MARTSNIEEKAKEKAENVATQLSQAVEKKEDDMARMGNSQEGYKELDAISDRIATEAHNAIEAALRKERAASARAREMEHRLEAGGQRMASSVRHYVETKPLASLGIAALVGFALSALIRR